MSEKLNVAVVFGGKSGEHEVSLMSATNVINAMDKDKYNIFMIGITRQGKWMAYKGDVSKIIDIKASLESDQPVTLADGINVIIGVGPAEITDTIIEDITVIGALQGLGIQSNMITMKVGELGTKAKRLITQKGQTAASLSKLVLANGNLLYNLYHDDIATDQPAGKMWYGLNDNKVYDKKIGIFVGFLNKDRDDFIDKIYLENVSVINAGDEIVQGSHAIVNNAVLMFEKDDFIE